MIQKLKPFIITLIPFTLFFFGIQYFVVDGLKEQLNIFFYSTWSIYVFHFFATTLIFLFVLFVHKTYPDKAGFAFMACSLLKMLAAIVFLLPLIQNKEPVLNDVLAFFIPYFLFLFVETFFTLKIINKE
ncbi:hypothetical protein [Maribacter sp.]|uniref:hypothetical protein n=1 Tax=Maribacter sp. TaxID=1897614 RepID=UPI0025C62C39|nr:hypothetical protein [Maribacter sp.]